MKKALIIMTFSAMAAGCADNSIPKAQLPELDTTNPLLAEWNTPHQTPPFSQIELSDYEPAFDAAIACSRAEIEAIVNNPKKPTFGNTIVALERQGALLDRISGVFYNLLEAATSDQMQEIALRVQPKLTELSNDVSLNPELFARVKAVYEKPGRGLSKEDRKLLEDTYQSFARNGAALSDADKELYRKYTSELSAATLQFGQNALAATNAFTINITDPKVVAELPAFVREGMAADAKARGEKGWTVTLQAPSYVPFMTYSSNRALKEKLWRAYNSRALGGENDNTQIVKQIAEDFKLKTGTLANTGYAIPSMIEDGQTLFDIVLKAIDYTLINTGKMFVLWDNFGKLTLTDVETAKLDLFVGDGSLATGFTYESEIDSEAYNKIKLVKDNKKTGKRDVYIFQDSKNMTLWGILQDYEVVDEDMNEAQIKKRGGQMLELYNRPKRSFSVSAIADLSVRAGRALYIGIGAVGVKSFFIVEEATHDLLKETMSLKLKVV